MTSAPRVAIVLLTAAAAIALVVFATRQARRENETAVRAPLGTTIAPQRREANLADAIRLPVPVVRAGGRSELNAASSAAPGSASASARIDLVVVDHNTREVIPGAHVWALGDDLLGATCDAAGRASFRVAPGLTFVGAEPPDDTGYVAITEDPVTGAPAAGADVSLAPGERTEVTLSLHLGATVRGRFFLADGHIAPEQSFRWFRFDDPGWILVETHSTNTVGRFEFRGLEPGAYMIVPPRGETGTFAPRRYDVAFGDLIEDDIRFSESRSVSFHVDVIQARSREQWPFPIVASHRYRPTELEVQYARSVGSSQFGREFGRRFGHDLPPIERSLEVTPGIHSMSLTASTGQRSGEAWISASWGKTVTIAVDERFQAEPSMVEVPDAGPIARIDGSFSGAFPTTPTQLDISWVPPAGAQRSLHMPVDPETLTFTVWVDLTQVTQAGLDFSVVGFKDGQTLATIRPVEGRQLITIGPRAR